LSIRDNADTSYLNNLLHIRCMENTTSQLQEQQKPVVLFTEDERKMLASIVADKYAIGPFTGMLLNAFLAHPEHSKESLIKTYLEVRSLLESLGKGYTYELESVQEKIGTETVTVNKFKKVIKK
jgi:hypothetical protein